MWHLLITLGMRGRMCCMAVVYLRAVDVRKLVVWGDGTAARSVSWTTVAVDTDNTVRGDSATQWCCHRGHLQVCLVCFNSCMHVCSIREPTWRVQRRFPLESVHRSWKYEAPCRLRAICAFDSFVGFGAIYIVYLLTWLLPLTSFSLLIFPYLSTSLLTFSFDSRPALFPAWRSWEATKPGLKLFKFVLSYSIFMFLMNGYFAL